MALEISNSALPYSLDAEQTVLGTIIINSDAIRRVAFLRPEHFHVEIHSKLFKIMYNMFIVSAPIDIITVIENSISEVFENQDEARSYLIKISEAVVNPSGIEFYANIIVEKHTMRALMYACRDIFEMAATGAEKPKQILEIAEKMIYELRGERTSTELIPIQAILTARVAEMRKPQEEKNLGTLKSSFSDLDHKIFGLNPSDLIIIAATPGMGKTSFALNIATGAAKLYPDKEIVVFSLEMSPEQLVDRMLSAEARITVDDMKNGRVEPDGWRRVYESVEILTRMKMFFDESSNISIGEMKSKLMRVKNLGLVVIDYLQLMSTGRRDGNRNLEIGEITRNLKLLAKDLNVPVILASQLSRAASQRGKSEKRPLLSDLRDSGSIEQDANIVIFLHRENPESQEAADNPDFNPNECECIVAKNRQGETGTIKLRWEGQYTKFSTYDHHHATPPPQFGDSHPQSGHIDSPF